MCGLDGEVDDEGLVHGAVGWVGAGGGPAATAGAGGPGEMRRILTEAAWPPPADGRAGRRAVPPVPRAAGVLRDAGRAAKMNAFAIGPRPRPPPIPRGRQQPAATDQEADLDRTEDTEPPHRAARPASDAAAPRVPLRIAGQVVGSVARPLGDALLRAALPLHADGEALVLAGPADAALAAIAGWLRDHGHAGRWRDEALAVEDRRGRVLGSVERGVVRCLGIATRSVQLHARAADGGGWWMQQRALDKATDPGRWDTLMGGMVAFGESVAQALERETREEAGIDLQALPAPPRACGAIRVSRPVTDSGSHGWLVETMHAFGCTLPAGAVPVNRDGEVLRFACLGDAEIDRLAAAGELTQEAVSAVAMCRATAGR
ncbi:NUDIX domain-containing protein [Xylophilus sp. Kf1]|nr:NUDIX domain-containing protein [Xylophilus sp. Kf1]